MKKLFDLLFPKAPEFNEHGRQIPKEEINSSTVMFGGLVFFIFWGISLYAIFDGSKNIKTTVISIIISIFYIAIVVFRFYRNRQNYSNHHHPFASRGEMVKVYYYGLIFTLLLYFSLWGLNSLGIIQYFF